MKSTVAYGLAVLMMVGMCVLNTSCRSSSSSRTIFQGDHNVTVVKKKRGKVGGRSKAIKGSSYRRVRGG